MQSNPAPHEVLVGDSFSPDVVAMMTAAEADADDVAMEDAAAKQLGADDAAAAGSGCWSGWIGF